MKAKKRFAQHFLKDDNIARKIADSLQFRKQGEKTDLLEIGGGTGKLTQFLLQKPEYELYVVEMEREAINFLKTHFSQLKDRLIEADFLKLNLAQIFSYPLVIIGNIPYNITGPIFFRILDYRHLIPEAVLMIQKEVALRVVAQPGTKDYSVLTVMLKAYYNTEFLFTVSAGAFVPRPRITSAVVRLKRKETDPPIKNYDFFRFVVKTAFNQRRKTVRNSLKNLYNIDNVPQEILEKRAEQLTLEDFFLLTNLIS